MWPGVIVTPDSVYQAVASLRRLLGDDPKQPAYIETVPRLGYRMIAKIEAGHGEAGKVEAQAADTAAAPDPARGRTGPKPRTYLILAGAALLVGCLLAYLRRLSEESRHAIQRASWCCHSWT